MGIIAAARNGSDPAAKRDADRQAVTVKDLAASKTGAKVVHLGQPAVDVLEKITKLERNPWVIVGTLPGDRLTDLQPFWQRLRS